MMQANRGAGFQKRLSPEEWKDGGLARIHLQVEGRVEGTVGCSCGWTFYHAREKVREDAIDRHLAKRHHGRGIRL